MTLTRREPFQREHQRSKGDLFRQPQSLREYLRELRDAVDAEVPDKLHRGSVDEGGTPEWTAAFRAFIAGSPGAVNDKEAEPFYVTPHRAALYRMTYDGAKNRAAAEYVFLLPALRYSLRDAWGVQLGFTRRAINEVALEAAESWAAEALRRWWERYVEQPRGRAIA